MSSNCSSHTPSNHSPGQQQSSTPGYQHISSPNGKNYWFLYLVDASLKFEISENLKKDTFLNINVQIYL